MEHLLGVLTHTLWFIFQVPTKTLCTNSTGMRFVKHAPRHARPPTPQAPLPLALSIFRYAKVQYLWQRMQTFSHKVCLESQSLD